MKNYIQPGDIITVTAPADIISGEIVKLGSLIGIASGDVLSGADMELALKGVFDLPKTLTDVVAVGDPLYFDESEANLTKTATDNSYAGVAVSAAGNGVETVAVIVNYPPRTV